MLKVPTHISFNLFIFCVPDDIFSLNSRKWGVSIPGVVSFPYKSMYIVNFVIPSPRLFVADSFLIYSNMQYVD